jgi:hypothetical protein
MNWTKRGLIFCVDGKLDWNKSHAQVPVVDVLADRLRVYYATRNIIGISTISFIETEKNNPSKVLYVHDKEILPRGKPGTFDDSGLMPTCILNVGNKKFLYYIGWTKKVNVPYHNSIGLAVSDDGINFKKAFEGPVFTTNQYEPYFNGTAWIMQINGIFKAWYLSCIRWEEIEGKQEPFYNIKYAESLDGIFWHQKGITAIDLLPGEGGLASPTIILNGDKYLMWFSYRSASNYRNNIQSSYKIGYAESTDGINWVRKDNMSGITVSKEGWDSEMICYPYIIFNNGYQMFYNGNGFGRSGFGYATLECNS